MGAGVGGGGSVPTNVGDAMGVGVAGGSVPTNVGDGPGVYVGGSVSTIGGDGAGVGWVFVPPFRLQSEPVMVAGRRYFVPSHSPTEITRCVPSTKCAFRISRLAV